MTIKKDWRYTGSLFTAALVSALSSLFGCFLIFAYSFQQYPAKKLVPFLLLVLELPLFFLALLISKRFLIPLWAVAFVYPFAVILIQRDLLDTKFFLIFVLGAGTISLALPAALFHYSNRFDLVPERKSQGAKYAPKD